MAFRALRANGVASQWGYEPMGLRIELHELIDKSRLPAFLGMIGTVLRTLCAMPIALYGAGERRHDSRSNERTLTCGGLDLQPHASVSPDL